VGSLRPLIKVGAVGVAAAAFLIAICMWWDARFVRAFQETERMTVRPEPRFCPSRELKADCELPSNGADRSPMTLPSQRAMSAD
jgi:hypothetical protein